MLDVAGFGFLVAVAEGDGKKPRTRHRQTQSFRTICVTTLCLLLIRLFGWRGRRRRRRQALVSGAFGFRAVQIMQDCVVDVVERRMARMNVLYDANLAGCCAQCEARNSSLENKYTSARPAIRVWNVINNHHIDIVWGYLLFIALGFNSLALRTYMVVI